MRTANEILDGLVAKAEKIIGIEGSDDKCFVWPRDMELLLAAGAEPIEITETEEGYIHQVFYRGYRFISSPCNPEEILEKLLAYQKS